MARLPRLLALFFVFFRPLLCCLADSLNSLRELAESCLDKSEVAFRYWEDAWLSTALYLIPSSLVKCSLLHFLFPVLLLLVEQSVYAHFCASFRSHCSFHFPRLHFSPFSLLMPLYFSFNNSFHLPIVSSRLPPSISHSIPCFRAPLQTCYATRLSSFTQLG